MISTPFLGNFCHLTPSGTLWYVTPIPFLSFSFLFFGLGKYVYVCKHYPREALPRIYNIIRALLPFPGRLLKARRETCTYTSHHTPLFLISLEASEKYPISREMFKNTSFSGFSREKSKNIPFPEKKEGNTRAAPCTFEWGDVTKHSSS